MRYTEQLLKHPDFLKIQEEITDWERERIYCHHELSHALDVCRMAWIIFLELYVDFPFLEADLEGTREKLWGKYSSVNYCQTEKEDLLSIKDRIYVTGLIHDIGRAVQYETGEHHAPAGQRIAQRILTDIGYPENWMRETLWIVGEHTGRTYQKQMWEIDRENVDFADSCSQRIAYCIARADHLSRNCFCCKAADTCKWKDEERNRTVQY